MNLQDARYTRFSIAREMLETADVVRRFDAGVAKPFLKPIQKKKGLLLTGEGSSRIFPAKRAMTALRRKGAAFPVWTEGATQALEYGLSDQAVMAASNSGKTKEVVRLFKKLQSGGHEAFFGVAATPGSPVVDLAVLGHVLGCGKEEAVAATKSVVEQALFIDAVCAGIAGIAPLDVKAGGNLVAEALSRAPEARIVESLAKASKLYFAGRNDGVAEELTLKTNEITRKKSGFLEGTYAVHGIEEVMDKDEAVILIEPFADEEEKFEEVLVKGVGLTVVAISSRPTRFPTFLIPEGGAWREVLGLCAGWSLLLEIGLSLGIDLDKPVRARKVGNEYLGK